MNLAKTCEEKTRYDEWVRVRQQFMSTGLLRHEAEALADLRVYKKLRLEFPVRNG